MEARDGSVEAASIPSKVGILGDQRQGWAASTINFFSRNFRLSVNGVV